MRSGVRSGAAIARSRDSLGQPAHSLSLEPWAVEFADTGASHSGRFLEIDCVRLLLAADVLATAEQRAVAVGVGADRVLIASGALSEETYLRALGQALGVAFEPPDGISRALCPIADERLIESAAAGLLPLALDGDLYLVVAPRGTAARRIIGMIEDSPARAQRFRFTSAERLNRFVLRYAGSALATQASDRIKQTWPMLSAAPPRWRGNIVPVAIVGLSLLAAVILAPAATMLAFEVMLAAVFLAWLGLRLTSVFVDRPALYPSRGLPDHELPVYTVIAALYREAASVDGLLSAIERLDYPVIVAPAP
jgi:glycosyltransferase XagB